MDGPLPRLREILERPEAVVRRRIPHIERNPVIRRPRKLPPEVAHERSRLERVGLDLICNACAERISRSQKLRILCHFYESDGPQGSPLTRCYVRCTRCWDDIVLGRNIGNADKFVIIAGATQQHHAPDDVPDPQNEAYPDAVIDSANDCYSLMIVGEPDDDDGFDDID